jgi:ATP-dependent helicase/nuclease subunit B
MSLRRHFLAWDRPLLPQAVAFLAGEWKGGEPLDLAEILVVVPTKQAGRRLREALAEHGAKQGAAVFPPRVMLPESLVMAGAAAAGVASRLESLLAWVGVLRDVGLDDFRQVFPVDPPARNFAWALQVAQDFSRLQALLAEGGLQPAEVPARAGEDFAEAARWRQIGELGQLHAERLSGLGRRDAQAAKIEYARAPAPPGGVKRIVVLGTPDPMPLAVTVLEAHARTLPVDVVVFAPAAEAAAFDGWGRPLAAGWEKRILVLPEFERCVHLCADPVAQVERAVEVARRYGSPEGLLGIGVADAEVLPVAENGLIRAGFATFNPEGHARQGDRLFQLLAALAGLAREDAFMAVEALARCPDFLEFLANRMGAGFSPEKFLKELDELHAEHLPPDLTEAQRQAPASRELAAVAELRATLAGGRFPANASAALTAIFGARRFDLSHPADALAAEAAEAWMNGFRAIAAAGKLADLTTAEGWDLALRLYGESVHYADKPAGAVELQGWLELLWEDAPHLLVAGFNDGSVPEAVVGDPFLPESLRERLGLKTNAARFARDAYQLQALAACRAPAGRLDLLLGKTSAAGDPLRPSRLLLRCAEADLPGRIGFLFRPADSARANPPWSRAWQLQPPRAAAPARVSVTALKQWLECPFRFYLGSVRRLKAVDPAKTELDALDFGSLVHTALEAFGREPALRDCTDAAVLRDFLLAALAAEAAKRFGPELTLPLMVQLESARQRLGRAADVQAQTRAAGWVIDRVEQKFDLDVGGLAVSGKIDRIDRHVGTGAIRVLDYKTSDRPDPPEAAHLRGLRRGETVPDFAGVVIGGRARVWRDLQLPLYLRALAAEFPGELACGYFNLPKAASDTGIAPWESYTPGLAEAAWRCAGGVAAAIRAGEFWPPNENVRGEYDPLAALFHRGAAASVAWPGAGP